MQVLFILHVLKDLGGGVIIAIGDVVFVIIHDTQNLILKHVCIII